jgi:hypothetical protein
MYPAQELRFLSERKASLKAVIAVRRLQCAEAAHRVARPLEWLDRVAAFWRRVSPIVQISALPLGFLVKKVFFRKHRILGSVAKWTPMVISALRGLGAAAPPRRGVADGRG